MVADASTAIFTVNAGGLKKTVSVYALGMDAPDMADAARSRQAFQKLADRARRLRPRRDDREPSSTCRRGYRGILLDGGPGDPDAKQVAVAGPQAGRLRRLRPTRTRCQLPVRVADRGRGRGARGQAVRRAGSRAATLIGPGDGKFYAFSLRPLLPDDDLA